MMLNMDKTKGANCNSWYANNKWIRNIKLMNDLLLMLVNLKEKYSDIISSNYCLFCNKEKETIDHLMLCSNLGNTWQFIIE